MNPRSLYLHVPFCSRKCGYCAFHSVTGASSGATAAIVNRMLRDMDELAASMPTLETLYVGGGTPTTLAPEELSRLLTRPRDAGARPSEITVEANPESTRPPVIRALERAGVTRLSLGVQSLEPRALHALGRVPTSLEQIARVRDRWPGILSVDLIHAAPGSTPAGFLGALRSLIELGVDHLSVYGLSVEPETPLARTVSAGRLALPDAHDWPQVVETLGSAGFRRYEVSNFARPGAECRHNMTYWNAEPYLGIGPSAVSTLHHNGTAVRYTQPADHTRYLRRPSVFHCARESLSPAQTRTEGIMLAMRRPEGITRSRLTAGRTPEETSHLQAAITRLAGEGLLELTADQIKPTNRGLDLLDQILPHLI